MNITFRTKKLEKLANNYRLCQKEFGKKRAELYHKRLQALSGAGTLEDTRNLPGNYHELVQNRKGQWACDLDHPYRLVFEPHEDPIPVDPDGRYEWIKIEGVEIVEIVDYH